MNESKTTLSNGFIEFYRGINSGLMYYQVRIELPRYFDKVFPPCAVFADYGNVSRGQNELLEYAQVFEEISKKCLEWAKHIRAIENEKR